MLRKVVLAGVCSLCLAGAASMASAHEFILKPDQLQAAAGTELNVQVQASHVFMISEEAEPVETVTLELVQGDSKQTVALAEDAALKALTGKVTLAADGPAMLVGHRLPQIWSDTTEGVLEGDRAALEAQGKKVIEVGKYEKFAKTVINPSAGDQSFSKVLGHDLELVLQSNPADLKAGDEIKVQALLNGKPAKLTVGLTYDGYSTENDAYLQKVESDDNGMATFTVTQAGLWMLRTACTEPVTDGSADKRNMRCTYVFPVK